MSRESLWASHGPVDTASNHESYSLPSNLSSHASLNRVVALQFACLKVALHHTTLNSLSAGDLKGAEDSLHSNISTARSTTPSLSKIHTNSQLDISRLRVQFIAVRSKTLQVVGNELKKGAEFVKFP